VLQGMGLLEFAGVETPRFPSYSAVATRG
jgi:hypothetical protein